MEGRLRCPPIPILHYMFYVLNPLGSYNHMVLDDQIYHGSCYAFDFEFGCYAFDFEFGCSEHVITAILYYRWRNGQMVSG